MQIIRHAISGQKQCIAASCETIQTAKHDHSYEQMQAKLQSLSETFQLLRDTHVRLQMQHDIIEADMRTSTEDLIRTTVCSRDADGRTHGG
jgi:predicted KAP-like P-loop ATPase